MSQWKQQISRSTTWLCMCALLLGMNSKASGQAFCALRDPVSTIHEFYPDATGHRSLVRTVDTSVKDALANDLPFSLHDRELGKHTLYIVLKGIKPVGLVHVRSEKGEWGLVEIAWALSLDLRVKGFRYQRCRNWWRNRLEQGGFAESLQGKRLHEIIQMLDDSGKELTPISFKVPHKAAPLAITTLKSAIKTIHVTEAVWGDDLKPIRAWMMATRILGHNDGIKLLLIEDVYSDVVVSKLTEYGSGSEVLIDRTSVVAYVIQNIQGRAYGLVMRADIDTPHGGARLWWVIKNGKVKSVEFDPLPNKETVKQVLQLAEINRLLNNIPINHPLGAATNEMLLIAEVHLNQ